MWFLLNQPSGFSRSLSASQKRLCVLAGLLLVINLILVPQPVKANPIQADPSTINKQFLYVESTGHSLINPVLRFYNRTGGEERHGNPLSELLPYKNHYIQYFERSLLEFFPEYDGTDQDVKLSPLGQLAATDAKVDVAPVVPFIGNSDIWYFPDKGHTLANSFLTYWRNSGDNAYFGQPISEEQEIEGPNNTKLVVQYFENVRLERAANDKNALVSLSTLGTSRAQQLLKPSQLAAVPKDRFNGPRSIRVPSLMFHYARVVDQKKDPLGYGLSILPENYIKFLDWTVSNGYNTVTANQIYDYLKYGILLPDKPVNFRWDDGHDNDWFVYQEMKKRGMTATFYVISRRLELTPAQWKQIDDDGFEVAAHTRTHPDLRSVHDLADEITGSKIDMEGMLGHPVRDFAYPYGKYNDTIKQVVRESGFEVAVSTNGGYNWTPDDRLEEPTLSVTGYDSVESFASKLRNASYAPSQNSKSNQDSGPVPTPVPVVPKKPAPVPTPVPVVPKKTTAPVTSKPKATEPPKNTTQAQTANPATPVKK